VSGPEKGDDGRRFQEKSSAYDNDVETKKRDRAEERMVYMKRIRSSWAVCILAVLLLAGLLLAFSGCGGEASVDELWEKSQEADNDINSFTMNVGIQYENTSFGTGQIQTFTYDVNGNNFHITGSIFGQTFSEIIVVGGTQYTRLPLAGQPDWTEQPAPSGTQPAAEQLGGFGDLPSIATASENLGIETVNGREVYHLRFTLTPDEISQLFRNVEPAQLQANSGGEVDVWIDKETNYRVKYEAVVRNVSIQTVGNGDVRMTINITNITEPININPPQ
jgi:outer membrane lipoprotein-sorting protein